MEILAFVVLWPFLALALGIALISLIDLNFAGGWWILLVIIASFTIPSLKKVIKGNKALVSTIDQLELLRQTAITFALALLAPVFVRYLIEALNTSLAAVIGGLVYGFVLVVWGMFIKDHKAISYGNIAGGALTLLYVYGQLWQLGELARVYATGFGLVVAVVVSIIKLRGRLAS